MCGCSFMNKSSMVLFELPLVHYYVIFGAVQERIHTCTSHFKSASVVRDQEVLSEPYDDDEMGLGVWHPYCIYFDRGLIEWLSYYVY